MKEGIYCAAYLALLFDGLTQQGQSLHQHNIFSLLFQGNSFQSFDLKLVWVDENCREKSTPGL